MKADAAAHKERAGEMCQKKVVVNVGPDDDWSSFQLRVSRVVPDITRSVLAQLEPSCPRHHSRYPLGYLEDELP
jgi:hypothetical protein